MANGWDDVQKQLNEYLKKNQKTNRQIQNATGESLDESVEELKRCILKYTDSRTVIDSIIIKDGSNPNEKIITFDPKKAYLRSEFNDPTSPIYQGGGYKSDAYMPLLRDEGYIVKSPKWKNYFGKGSSGISENFIQLGIEEYQRKNKGKLTIKVEKIFDVNYSDYNNTISETNYY